MLGRSLRRKGRGNEKEVERKKWSERQKKGERSKRWIGDNRGRTE